MVSVLSFDCYKLIEENKETGDIIDVSIDIVDKVIAEAHSLIASDPFEYFMYKLPKVAILNKHDQPYFEESGSNIDNTNRTSTIKTEMEFISIGTATHASMLATVRNYINTWVLDDHTKYVLVKQRSETIPGKGAKHFIDATFSKPTIKCPNPLPVATVHFCLNISALLPTYYPVMLTYRFEGYKSVYYALGTRCLRSSTFQRFFIESIIHSKLMFYVEIFECRRQTKKPSIPEETHPAQEDIRPKPCIVKKMSEPCDISWKPE